MMTEIELEAKPPSAAPRFSRRQRSLFLLLLFTAALMSVGVMRQSRFVLNRHMQALGLEEDKDDVGQDLIHKSRPRLRQNITAPRASGPEQVIQSLKPMHRQKQQKAMSKQHQYGSPAIVWLASYPNSGTSYTMTLAERASNLSTATNYGVEVTALDDNSSIPLHPNHPEGPYWEGTSGKLGRIRALPDQFVLTKTHCGGRCVNCGANEYVTSRSTFLQACERTSALLKGHRVEYSMDAERVARMVHLIRNPYHNIVARYHLERRHMIRKDARVESRLPNNATGFQRWCKNLDDLYANEERHVLDRQTRMLLQKVPCRGEFYKWVQWHERVIDMTPMLGDGQIPVLVLHYEEYAYHFNKTVDRLLDFLQQEQIGELRPFRALPNYQDHFTTKQKQSAAKLMQTLASPRVWSLVKHYFRDENDSSSSSSSSKTQ